MAKTRRQHSIAAAIGAVTSAIRAEANPDLSAEQKTDVVNAAMDIVDDSGVLTMAEHADDNVETLHQVDEVFDGAGQDRVALQRQGAIDGARATVEAIEAEQELTPAEDAALTEQEQAFEAEEQAEQTEQTD